MYLIPDNSAAINNRKWNLALMGCNFSQRGIGLPPQKRMPQHACPDPRRTDKRTRLNFLSDGEDRSQYDLAGNLLRDANSRLKALEAQFASRTLSNDFGPKLIEARNRYETLLSAYIYAYGAAFGPPDTTGLEGLRPQRQNLGQFQIYVAAGVAIAVIVAALYELGSYISVLEQQAATQANAQQQAANLQNQAAAAYQTGDASTGDKLTALAQQQINLANPPSNWLSSNWPWLVGGGVLFFLFLD
jgi:type II secretory pathway component PulL